MIKLLVSDVDGTLIQRESVDFKDKVALQRLAENGIQICLASGRMYPELQKLGAQLQLQSHCVSQNGSFVHAGTGELIYTASFDLGLARELQDYALEQGLPFTMSCNDNQIYIPLMEGASRLKERMFMPVIQCSDIGDVLKKGILPCKLTFFGDLSTLNCLRQTIEEKYANQIDTYIADKDCLDVMPAHVSKGNGLTHLLRYLDITPQEMVCVGDSFNDLSMFQLTPYSFAMTQSDDSVRQSAKNVVHSVSEVVDWVCMRSHCKE